MVGKKQARTSSVGTKIISFAFRGVLSRICCFLDGGRNAIRHFYVDIRDPVYCRRYIYGFRARHITKRRRLRNNGQAHNNKNSTLDGKYSVLVGQIGVKAGFSRRIGRYLVHNGRNGVDEIRLQPNASNDVFRSRRGQSIQNHKRKNERIKKRPAGRFFHYYPYCLIVMPQIFSTESSILFTNLSASSTVSVRSLARSATLNETLFLPSPSLSPR